MTANYLAALHGAKINFHLMIRVNKTPLLMSRIEPQTFRSSTVYVTTTLHWYSNSCHLNMVYNHVSLSGTIIKKHSYCIWVLPRHCHSVCCYCRQSCFLLLLMLLMLFDFMFSQLLSLMLLVSFVSSFGRRLPTTKHCPADGFGLAQMQEGGSRTQGGLWSSFAIAVSVFK